MNNDIPLAVTEIHTPPPGTKKISDNFYVDKKELSVIDYRFYLHWLNVILGEGSNEYRFALPDTSDMDNSLRKLGLGSARDYFASPKYDEYPMIGINYDQALAYMQWRSDRVYEKVLVDKEIILYDDKQNRENFFSIAKYLSREYPVVKENSVIPYPVFRLPSEDDWELIARKVFKKDHIELTERNRFEIPFRPLTRIVGLAGNVSEMVEEKGVCKGLNWTDATGSYSLLIRRHYTGSHSWLGVRYVCSWEAE